ncbi:MAG: hypothetical protein GEU80_01440 [Dehalococcoidia bacterium]|nr:hypothetical protein [Dehalococcoidia bacterium]
MLITGRTLRSLPVLAVAALLSVQLLAPYATAQETGRTVSVGTGEPGYAVNLFGPGEVTVNAGATVTFENPWFEPHTVTFYGDTEPLAPSDPTAPVPTNPGEVVEYDGTSFLNSGFLFEDPFQVTFPDEGEFPFVCIIHPGMAGTITVVAADEDVPSQAELDAEAEAIFAQALDGLKTTAGALAAQPISEQANADGTSTWSTAVVGGLFGPSDVQQFFPASIDVGVGDTVVWESTVPTPHTVTFPAGPPPFPEDMMDPLAEETFLAASGPNDAFGGSGFVHSGVIGLDWPAGQSYEVTFTAPGTYQYICLLHADQAMVGVVNVSADDDDAEAQATPTAPATPAPGPAPTGNAGLDGSGGGNMVGMLAVGALVLLTGIAAVAARRRTAR